MKYCLSILIGVVSVFVFGQENIENQIDIPSNHVFTQEQVDLIFQEAKDFPENTELSIAYIQNGQPSFFGVKRQNDSMVYINNVERVFEIGSVTKVFTSTLLANFALQGDLELNAPIQNYVSFPIKNKEITTLQLSNHTAGLPILPTNMDLTKVDISNPYAGYNEENLIAYLTDYLKSDTVPGTRFQYSNVGAGILGFLLQQKSGLSYEELLQKYVCTKYGLNSTSTDLEKVESSLIGGLDYQGDETAHWNMNALMGAGGILSNVQDLSKFLVAHFDSNNEELALTRKSTFEIKKYGMEMGLGWKILDPFENGLKWCMHNGGTGGFTSILALDDQNKNGIVILSNVSSFNDSARNIDNLCIELMKTF